MPYIDEHCFFSVFILLLFQNLVSYLIQLIDFNDDIFGTFLKIRIKWFIFEIVICLHAPLLTFNFDSLAFVSSFVLL